MEMVNVKAFGGMVLAILSQTGGMVIAKVAITHDMDKYVLVFYTYALSFLLLLPFTFLHSRRSHSPPLTFSSLCSFFLLALFGCCAHILSYVGLDLSSPTLATALLNLVPAFTFILALILRMEVVECREHSSQAKVFGTLVSIGGALVVTFYKGPPIFSTHPSLSSSHSNWVLGAFFCAADSFFTSLWYIYQASVMNKYPAVMVVVFFQIFFSTIMSGVFALMAVRDVRAWVLRLDMGLVSVFYQALVATAIRYSLCTWCVQKAGALFCTMFKPVGIIFTFIMAALFLGDPFHLGSLIGAVIIVVGFYGVMWGKAQEQSKIHNSHNLPLLQNKS